MISYHFSFHHFEIIFLTMIIILYLPTCKILSSEGSSTACSVA